MLLKVTLLTAPPELTEKLYFPNNVKEANLKIDTLWINKAKSLDCADLFSETFPGRYIYIFGMFWWILAFDCLLAWPLRTGILLHKQRGASSVFATQLQLRNEQMVFHKHPLNPQKYTNSHLIHL